MATVNYDVIPAYADVVRERGADPVAPLDVLAASD